MLIVISPAKTLDFSKLATTSLKTDLAFASQAANLVKALKKLSINDLQSLMGISYDLASLNVKRFNDWKTSPTMEGTLQAVFAFRGEVYTGLHVDDFTPEDLEYSQAHLRILSGLYGVLRPLDGIQPYRLEMGTPIRIGNFKNLYEYWGNKITTKIAHSLSEQGDTVLVNLASNEYFKAIKTNTLKATIITPAFKDYKEGEYRMISFFAKKARGMMVRFILKNKLNNPDDLKLFEDDGYFYNHSLSKPLEPVFTRG
jgi:cytoplasmic iron level regulating protein YaaA (DUF328/UPF0246 family)